MKPPDDNPTRMAQLRRELIDAFMRGDVHGWREATRELTRMLREEGVRPRIHGSGKIYPIEYDREFWKPRR